ncbi:endolytic transglycosylase MltG [Pseudoxanthobacter sp.]|uniref:endolytic transglycosylase MltG n=1 Tax=Pseudoxanthobacter sp. TaxID=1925742 RepID=UPI002FDF1725
MSDPATETPPPSGPGRPAPKAPQKVARADAGGTPPQRSRHARNPLVLVLNFFLTSALLLVLLAGGLLYWSKSLYEQPGPLKENAVVVITSGSTLDDIASALENAGVISNRWVFEGASKFFENTGKLKAGEYAFVPGMTMRQVMDEIVAGRSIQHAMTVPEGVTSAQVVDKLAAEPLLSGVLTTIPAEGTLLPETYKFTRGAGRKQMIERMTKAQSEALAEIWAGRDPSIPLKTPEELVILASLVEKETGVAGERPRIAGVFINRLRKGMKLQSDPTILYGLYGGASWKQARTIMRSDLQRPNPYNTYQITGLPPGPIANPGRAAMEAVAHPADTDALYFVADGTGGHVFAKSLDDHNRNVARWRALQQSLSGGDAGNAPVAVQPATPAN